MLRSTALHLVALIAVASSSACDTSLLFGPPRKIESGGEGESGEGEGEGAGAGHSVCGGQNVVVASTPIAMTHERARHRAVLLQDGRVLVAGGIDSATQQSQKSAELFDPSTSTFSAAGSMHEGRIDFALVALDDGRAVAFGGFDNDPADPTQGSLATTEIFDPTTGQWSAGPSMPEARDALSAVKIRGGKVLVFGGQTNSESLPLDVLLFNASDDSIAPSGHNIASHGTSHTAIALADGRALVVGGFFTSSLANVDVIDEDGSVSAVANIPTARRSACSALDDAGNSLVFGGYNGDEVKDIETFNAVTGAWTKAGDLSAGRAACASVKMSCIDLVCGSFSSTTCEAWDLTSKAPVDIGVDTKVNFDFQLTSLQNDDHVLLTGGSFNDSDVSQNALLLSLEPAP